MNDHPDAREGNAKALPWLRTAGQMAVLSPFLVGALLSLRRMADSDLWAHLKCGEYLFRHHHVLKTYFFNCSWPDFPYVNHSWLFQAIIYAVQSVAGEWGLVAMQVLLVLAAFALLAGILRSLSGNTLLITAVLIVGIMASQHRFALRPQHFTFVFLTAFITILHRSRRGPTRTLWLLPLIMLLWVNMHAESLWGIVILSVFLMDMIASPKPGADAGGADWKRILPVAGAVLLAALLNPFTWKTVLWPIFVMKEQFAGVEEILPPTGIRFVFFWIYFGLVVLSVLLNFRRSDRFWLSLSVIFCAVAWTANRGIPHFVFVSAPLLVRNVEDIAERFRGKLMVPRSMNSAAHILLLSLVAVVCISIVTSPRYLNKYDNTPYPENALSFLRTQGITGNVINEHIWGGFIIWNAWPGLKPYIDGRFFHKRFYDEYFPLLAGKPGWDRLLDKYGVTIAILTYSPNSNPRLNDRLFADPHWRLVYWDDVSLVYLRDTESHMGVLREHGNDLLNIDRDLYAEYSGRKTDSLRRLNAVSERNIQAAGSSWKARVVAANTWFAQGEYFRARERYEEALRLQQQADPRLYFKIALCYRAEGDLAQAQAYAERCLALVPGSQAAADLLREISALRGMSKNK